ncbi:MAG: carboxypeptidase-like regulatory domain-containing protein [Flavobacteriaceae bacterium]|nr:carboxypeptidase-like regulatory domain-containing protein [Flavobacteriaceae bacterium]
MRYRILVCCFILLGFKTSVLQAQVEKYNSNYVLFTGLVLTSDSLKPIQYVSIRTQSRSLIGYTDYLGHFDVVVKKGDTIFFSQIEQSPSWHIVPDTLKGNRYSVIKLMVQDTLEIPAIYIRALPLKSLFNYEFVNDDIPDDLYERARKNLANEALKEELRMQAPDAHSSQLLLEQTRANQLYYFKQAPPQGYFNPAAWMQFIEAWKRGDFKKKAQKKSTYISPY